MARLRCSSHRVTARVERDGTPVRGEAGEEEEEEPDAARMRWGCAMVQASVVLGRNEHPSIESKSDAALLIVEDDGIMV